MSNLDVKCRSKLGFLLKKVSQLKHWKAWNTRHWCWSRSFFHGCISTFRQYSRILHLHTPPNEVTYTFSTLNVDFREANIRVWKVPRIWLSSIRTPSNWGVLSACTLSQNILKFSGGSSSGFSFPCKWRARARKSHKQLLSGCLVFSSKM